MHILVIEDNNGSVGGTGFSTDIFSTPEHCESGHGKPKKDVMSNLCVIEKSCYVVHVALNVVGKCMLSLNWKLL